LSCRWHQAAQFHKRSSRPDRARRTPGALTVNQLAEPFPITLQAVSKHLKVLERAGLISRGRSAQLRPSRLQGAPLKEAVDWLETYSRFWQAGFDRLDERMQRTSEGPDHG
jgi:DNA-binding transcriptional ArsR family regulator